MSDDLLKRMARALAEADGNQEGFDACDDPSREREDGFLARYMNAAEQLLRKSGLAEEIYKARYQYTNDCRSPIHSTRERSYELHAARH